MKRSDEYRVAIGERDNWCSHSPIATRYTVVLVLLMVLGSLRSNAQDIHFSQFFHTPLATNPALIGQFDGQYRLNGVFRQQWRAVTTPYRTFGLGGDAADFMGRKGLGAGAWLHHDQAGDARLQQFHLSLGGSWTQTMGSNGTHALTAGVRAGFTSLSLDPGQLRFDSQYNGFYFDPNLATGEQFARDAMWHSDVHAGLVWTHRPAPRTMVQAGVALFNITRPAIGFLGEPGVPLDSRLVVHAQGRFKVAEKLDLEPMFQMMGQGTFRETDFGGVLRHIMLDRYGLLRAVRGGLFYRAADAGYVYGGIEYDDWTFGVSYDINLSDLVPASRNRGGIEFSVIRIFRQRPAVPVRYKACPEQM